MMDKQLNRPKMILQFLCEANYSLWTKVELRTFGENQPSHLW
jgi:hypothetical protein